MSKNQLGIKITQLQLNEESLRETIHHLQATNEQITVENQKLQEDVMYLTQEAERLLTDLHQQSSQRIIAEDKLRMLSKECQDMQRELPAFNVDAKEIAVLRELKRINDRDNKLLQEQNQ